MIRAKKEVRLSWRRQSCLCSAVFVAPASRRRFGLDAVAAVFRPPAVFAAHRCRAEVEFAAAGPALCDQAAVAVAFEFGTAIPSRGMGAFDLESVEARARCCKHKSNAPRFTLPQSSRQKFSHIAQNFRKHRIRKLARKCILLARMVRRKQPRQISRQLIIRAMPKRKSSQSRNLPALFQQSQISPHRDAAQYQHSARLQNFEVALPKVAAIRKLRRQRLVRRRRATQRSGHIGILQRESVFAIRRSGLIGKSRAEQRLVKKIAGAIAREHSSRAIGAVRSRRKPQNQKLGARIAETRNGLAPIIPSKERTALVPRDLFAIPYQSRTLAAENDFLIEFFQFSQARPRRKVIMNPRKPAKRLRNMSRSFSARRSRRRESQTLVVCGLSRSSSAQKTSESIEFHG